LRDRCQLSIRLPTGRAPLMDITKAFKVLQESADADPGQVAEARSRRDVFRKAFGPETDVVEVIPSGSLARSTQREPINDVDVVIVFDRSAHPDWGQDGESAMEALTYLQKRIKELLGTADGTVDQVVRRADRKNHAVKCFLDDPDDPNAFTVDAMPALRESGGELLVPERLNERWVRTHPEYLIERVKERQQESSDFRPLVRVLKLWNDREGQLMKSLVIEVLALHHLPADETRPRALQRFFQAATNAVLSPVCDPAGLCGEIQPDLDRQQARALLDGAASSAWKAVNAQDQGETDRAGCLWREVFGDVFPEPEGGCQQGEAESGSAGFFIGTGAVAGAGEQSQKKRPIIDAPQG